jgi:RNA polymerase sigma-70 factor (ECF subfamily)
LHQFRGESSLATWIGRVAFTVALRHTEKLRLPIVDDEDGLLMAAVPSDDDVAAAFEGLQSQALLAQAIETLPALQRLVLTLYHLQELPIAEVAAITGMAEGTIKSHLHRSRAKLRELLAPQLGEK